ncbi:Rha family transcriptional regulator [uncultured Sphingomonas sp.]|uniref:Rha family transcriptional regulator n=1 Tax=uncultured Sphingomonas sp. TaxID=158754 RepID=UPI00338E5963
MADTHKRTVDSREIAQAFAQRHHNTLSAIDLVLRQCPAAAVHFQFRLHTVPAGLGGTRHVRRALISREGFMLLSMSFPSKQRELALQWLVSRFNQ